MVCLRIRQAELEGRHSQTGVWEREKHVVDWAYSTFHQHVAREIYVPNWCGDINNSVDANE